MNLDKILPLARRKYKDALRGYNYNTEIVKSYESRVISSKQDIKEYRKATENRIRFIAIVTTLEDVFSNKLLQGDTDDID